MTELEIYKFNEQTMLTDAKQLLITAKQQRFAVPAFNVSSVEAAQAVFEAAADTQMPIIVELSKGEASHLTPKLAAMICESLAKELGVEYVLHLDRGNDIEFMKECLDAGFNSVSADFNLPYSENLDKTKEVRELTNQYNAQLEATVEYVPYVGYSKMSEGDLVFSEPSRAAAFAEITELDSIIISIGTQSGKYKEIGTIRYEILEEANKLMPKIPFVLHGGSFLAEEITTKSISLGITKINVNSELRLAYTEIVKKNIAANEQEYAPYRLLNGAKDAMKQIAIDKLKLYRPIK